MTDMSVDLGQKSIAVENIVSVHDALREARQAQAIDLDTVAQELCIRASYLRAIETADLSALPDHTFTIGFVRAYADFLGLDACEIVSQYRAQHDIDLKPSSGASATVSAALFHNPSDQGMSGLAMATLGLVGLLLLLWIVGWGGEEVAPMTLHSGTGDSYLNDRSATADADNAMTNKASGGAALVLAASTEDVAPIQLESAMTATPAPTAQDTSPATQPAPKPAAMRVNLRAIQDTWMKLRSNGGGSIWAGVLRKDETRVVDTRDAVFLTTSNAGALMFSVADSAEVRMGEHGEPLVDLQLGGAGAQFTLTSARTQLADANSEGR